MHTLIPQQYILSCIYVKQCYMVTVRSHGCLYLQYYTNYNNLRLVIVHEVFVDRFRKIVSYFSAQYLCAFHVLKLINSFVKFSKKWDFKTFDTTD